MKQIFFLIALSIVFGATAQTVQTGIVQEYNEKAKKTPLAGVELNVRSANSAVSDKKGKFSLQFLTLKPGEKVNVRRIEKLGYEIFNKEAVEQWNINPKNPFIIVMCRSDRFKKIRDNYEKVSSESYARQLKKEEATLVKLKAEGKLKETEYQQQLIQLEEYYEKQKDNIASYVDRFARIDLSELSAAEQKIIELVQAGKINEAIKEYEAQNYVDKYAKEIAQIKEISNAIDKLNDAKTLGEQSCKVLLCNIDRQIETLKLAGGKENFERVGEILKELCIVNPHDSNLHWKYLQYLNDQRKYTELAEEIPNYLSLDLNKKELFLGKELQIRTLANIGKFDEAESYCSNIVEELKFANELSEKEKALIYSRVGTLYLSIEHPKIAEPYITLAASLYPEFNSPDNFEDVINYLKIKLAYLYNLYSLGKMDKFKEETLLLYDKCKGLNYSDCTNQYKAQLTSELIDLSQMLEMALQFDEAIILSNICESLINEIIIFNPEQALPLYGMHYQKSGTLYNRMDNYPLAEEYFIKALKYYEILENKQPLKYRALKGLIYNNLSNLYTYLKQANKAMEFCERAYNIAFDNYQKAPYYYHKSYYHSCVNKGRIAQQLKQYDVAETAFSTAIDLRRQQFEEIGDSFQDTYWRSKLDLAVLYIETEQSEKSLALLNDIITTGDKFISKEHELYDALNSFKYYKGRLLRITNQLNEAKIVLENLISIEPPKSNWLSEIARVNLYLHNKNAARKYLKQALDLTPNLLEEIDDEDILNQIYDKKSGKIS